MRFAHLAPLLLLAAPQIAAAEEFDCVIEAQQTVKLASPVAGVIGAMLVDRGDWVHKGQIVARLNDGLEQATLALARAKAANDYALQSARAKFEFLQAKHARTEALIGKGYVSKENYDET